MARDRRASWLKGVLDLLVLSCLVEGESYGYEIARHLEEAGLGKIRGGTLYPVLNRMEEAGLVRAEYRAAERGPGRRYYQLTPEGERALSEQREAWLGFHRAVADTLTGATRQGADS
ncbi:PadR family transcriptional regulator [Streptomyces sp. NPDC005438]|uniref:PadR family transcriptional regulator n=1 Tax=Streptomyces sp. NPDC005438 TaxID=3156880 RepID=UPI0033BD6B73